MVIIQSLMKAYFGQLTWYECNIQKRFESEANEHDFFKKKVLIWWNGKKMCFKSGSQLMRLKGEE